MPSLSRLPPLLRPSRLLWAFLSPLRISILLLPRALLFILHALQKRLQSPTLCLMRSLCYAHGWATPSATDVSHEPHVHFAHTTLRALYAARGARSHYLRYTPCAVFEDPVLRAQGRAQVAAVFDALRLLFARCAPLVVEVLVHAQRPHEALVVLVVEYEVGAVGKVRVVSVVRLRFAPDGRCVAQEERWLGLPLVGGPARAVRKAVAAAVEVVVGKFPPRKATSMGSGKG